MYENSKFARGKEEFGNWTCYENFGKFIQGVSCIQEIERLRYTICSLRGQHPQCLVCHTFWNSEGDCADIRNWRQWFRAKSLQYELYFSRILPLKMYSFSNLQNWLLECLHMTLHESLLFFPFFDQEDNFFFKWEITICIAKSLQIQVHGFIRYWSTRRTAKICYRSLNSRFWQETFRFGVII